MTTRLSVIAIEHATGGSWITPPTTDECYGVAIDTREPLADACYIAIRGERHDGHAFVEDAARGGARVVIVDQEVPAVDGVGVLRVKDTRTALIDLARWHRTRLERVTVVGITGSVGKTTTRSLIHAALSTLTGTSARRSFNNEIGVPLTLLATHPDDRYALVEIGMNAPGEIDRLGELVQPDIVVLTRVGRAHLEGLGDVGRIAIEKASLLKHLKPGGRVLANVDAPEIRPLLPADATTWGLTGAAGVRPTIHETTLEAVTFDIDGSTRFTIPLAGSHNAANAIPAILIARDMGVSEAEIAAGLQAAEVPPMRMDVCAIGSITVCNDAYNANPDSAAASIETFCTHTPAGRRVVVLGDMLELGTDARAMHREVGTIAGERLSAESGDRLILIGPLAGEAIGSSPGAICFDTLDDPAAEGLAALLRPGDHVLLKGSRGARLERLIPVIETWVSRERPTTTAAS